ncbi:hypothetical protein BJ138DRAFT_1143657 [Hygrophoropsis aurantiaca]|uniref:Uncharacterized protein n=1 Tax=Hygrophoropsis aurantiaca TaxID=72124 RepID=A0ACB8AMX9_9AGAM|nr:hypothetical protein BJ138DRAFT_1143657 [Hygrophoropsis aurantiaca]
MSLSVSQPGADLEDPSNVTSFKNSSLDELRKMHKVFDYRKNTRHHVGSNLIDYSSVPSFEFDDFPSALLSETTVVGFPPTFIWAYPISLEKLGDLARELEKKRPVDEEEEDDDDDDNEDSNLKAGAADADKGNNLKDEGEEDIRPRNKDENKDGGGENKDDGGENKDDGDETREGDDENNDSVGENSHGKSDDEDSDDVAAAFSLTSAIAIDQAIRAVTIKQFKCGPTAAKYAYVWYNGRETNAIGLYSNRQEDHVRNRQVPGEVM